MKAITSHIDQFLRPLGFTRRKATWNRRAGQFIDVADVQVSKSGGAFTLNVGVVSRRIHQRFYGRDADDLVEQPDCTVGIRIGRLRGWRDVWWTKDDPQHKVDIEDRLSADAVPFFERLHSLEAMRDFLAASEAMKQAYPPPKIYLALLIFELGDQKAGCESLAAIREGTVHGWQLRIGEIEQRLTCS